MQGQLAAPKGLTLPETSCSNHSYNWGSVGSVGDEYTGKGGSTYHSDNEDIRLPLRGWLMLYNTVWLQQQGSSRWSARLLLCLFSPPQSLALPGSVSQSSTSWFCFSVKHFPDSHLPHDGIHMKATNREIPCVILHLLNVPCINFHSSIIMLAVAPRSQIFQHSYFS